jgi:release factor glutamine methyltransferase
VKEFAGLPIRVAPGVFRPRTVSAEVYELGRRLTESVDAPVALDVGTGSGAIAVAYGVAVPRATVYATDTSSRALRCARTNAHALGAPNVRFLRGHLLAPLPRELQGGVDVMMTNLPYVIPSYAVGIDWGAPVSTVAGRDIDGLGLMRTLADEARRFLRPGGWLVSQLTDWQWEPWVGELRSRGYHDFVPPPVRRPGYAVVGAARWSGSA